MKDIEHVALNPLDESGVGKMIRVVRDKQVLLDSDLATLYGVETKYINRAVKRNTERFPDEFYFELTKEEFLRCQMGLRTNSWTQLEDASCTLLKNKSPRRWKHSMI